MITIVDYGSGNINAITNIYDLLKTPYNIASGAQQLEKAEKIILPGVGSFDYCMAKLNNSGLKEILNKKVLEQKTPVLGICIGLHLMASGSEEGKLPGLGWIKGSVKRFDETKLQYKPKVPHMGWNTIKIQKAQELFLDVNEEQGFYFIHSFYMEVDNTENIMTRTNYGHNFVSGIIEDNIYAVQFHPEKSHSNGMKLLRNFSRI